MGTSSRSGNSNIILVGFMGTGKTSVAKELARRLGRRYVSMDRMIEERERMPVAEIFSKHGEAHFRDVESEVAKEVADMSDVVVDAGGGVVTRDENVSALTRNGILICLTASVDKIVERTKGRKHRPLLNVEDPKAKIEELLSARKSFYAKADREIDTSALSISEVVDKIIKEVGTFPKEIP